MKIQAYKTVLTSVLASVAMACCSSVAVSQDAPEIEAFIAGINNYDNYDAPVISRPDLSNGSEVPSNALPNAGADDFVIAPDLVPEKVPGSVTEASPATGATNTGAPDLGSEEYISDYFEENYYDGSGAPPAAATWVLGISVPIFDREFDGDRLFAFNPTDLTQTLSSNDADPNGTSGIDVTLARRSSSGLGFEARYWGLFAGAATQVLGGTPTTAIGGLSQITDNGVALSDTFNTADFHALTRDYSFNNVELNVLRNGRTFAPLGRALTVERLCGFRYVQFDESLEYAGVSSTNRVIRSALNSSVQNSLFGFQTGARAEWQLLNRASFSLGGKLGLFNNRAQTNIVATNQQADLTFSRPQIGSGTNAGADFEFGDNKDDLSLLGELDLGLIYQMTTRSRLRLGYRVLGISDIADAEKNIPGDFTNTTELGSANTDGDLVLRGGYVGVEIAF